MKHLLIVVLAVILTVPAYAKFKPIKNKIEFAGFKLVSYESEHYIVIAEDGQEKKYSENLEKVWEITSAMSPDLIKCIKSSEEGSSMSGKLFIFVFKNKPQYVKFGQWYVQALQKAERHKEADLIAATWPVAGISNVKLLNKELQNLNLDGSMGMATYGPQPWVGKYGTSFSHFSAVMTNRKAAAVNGANMPFWMNVGYGYYMEIGLCRKSTTTYLDLSNMSAGGANPEDIAYSKAFAGGSSWSSTIKKLLRNRKFTAPTLEELERVGVADLTPERAGFLYGMTHFLINHKHKQGKYGELLDKLHKGEDGMTAMLEVFGYKTKEEFTADWIKYMKSSKFR